MEFYSVYLFEEINKFNERIEGRYQIVVLAKFLKESESLKSTLFLQNEIPLWQLNHGIRKIGSSKEFIKIDFDFKINLDISNQEYEVLFNAEFKDGDWYHFETKEAFNLKFIESIIAWRNWAQ